ncbi:MAG: HEAT repeat domain-containing protein [Candidatus Hodarchaeota archaeon]
MSKRPKGEYDLIRSVLGALGVVKPDLKRRETVDLIAIQPLLPHLKKRINLIGSKNSNQIYLDFLEFLLELLNDKSRHLRESSAYLLGWIADPTTTPYFIEKIQIEKQPGVRIRILEALGRLKAKEAIPVILKALDVKNWKVRRAAIEALEEINDLSVVSVLIKVLKNDKEANVRAAAASSIGKFGSRKWTFELNMAFEKEPDDEVKFCIAEALNILGEPQLLNSYLKET